MLVLMSLEVSVDTLIMLFVVYLAWSRCAILVLSRFR